MYKRNEKSFFKHIDFIILDSIVMQIAFAISYMLRHGLSNPYALLEYRQMAIILGVLLICLSFMTGGYRDILYRGYLQEFKQCAKIVTLLMLLLMAYLFVIHNSNLYSRYVVVMSWLIGLYFIYMEHIIWKSILISKIQKGENQRQILLVAANRQMAEEVLQDQKEQKVSDICFVGILLPDDNNQDEKLFGIPILRGIDEGLAYVSEHVVDEVLIFTTLTVNVPDSFIEDCLNMGVVVHQNLKEKIPTDVRKEVSKIGNYLVVTACINSATPKQLFIKRAMDIAGSIVGLFFTGLVFLFVAPIIKIQSPGPVIFKQKRMGKNGRQFVIYKFRSMYMDAEERKAELMEQNKMSGPIAKFDHDPRIFPFGRFIRKWSIDELPQFWNVLKGDMSLVGTRPPTVDEYEQYELYHKKRLATKPGLTGMWQVSGRSDIEDFEEIIRLDSQYISEWRIGLDIRILFQTVLVVFRKKGAE